MDYSQVFYNIPPNQLDGLNCNSDQDNEWWAITGDFPSICQSQHSLTWRENFPCLVQNHDCLPGEIQDLSTLSLSERQIPHNSLFQSGLHEYSLLEHNVTDDCVPIQPYPYFPIATHCPPQISPMDTVRSQSSGYGDQLCLCHNSSTSDEESIDSPPPLSPSQEADDISFGFPFPHEDFSNFWTTSFGPYCALREIQLAPDDEHDMLRHPHEPKFNLNEVICKEDLAIQTPLIIKMDDDHSSLEPWQSDLAIIERRSSDTSGGENDSDYRPAQTKAHRSQLAPSNNPIQSSTRSKVAKKSSRKVSVAKSGKGKQHMLATLTSVMQKPASASSNTFRPFSCPLAPYGCSTTFTSKNEWKRHILSRHLCLGFWRCDLCPDSDARPNDFNRKDLFTQHLRRMHHPHRAEIDISNRDSLISKQATSKKPKLERRNSQSDDDASTHVFENSLASIRSRCWVHTRDVPKKGFCGFCERLFEGASSFDAWLEHVGKHLAESAKRRPASGLDAGWATAKWQKDENLREWLLKKGVLKAGTDAGTWVLAETVTGEV